MNTISPSSLRKAAIMGGLINAILNGLQYWIKVKNEAGVSLTNDLISSTEDTVFAGAVPLATLLAFMLTSISYFTLKIPGKPAYFPKVFLLALKNAIFSFGIVTILAILLQRFAGSITVSPFAAALIISIIAGLVAGIVDYLTKSEITR